VHEKEILAFTCFIMYNSVTFKQMKKSNQYFVNENGQLMYIVQGTNIYMVVGYFHYEQNPISPILKHSHG
jgi:hypothetical protein